MNLPVPSEAGSLLTSWVAISFPGRTLLRVVEKTVTVDKTEGRTIFSSSTGKNQKHCQCMMHFMATKHYTWQA
jgi:hypothetical protein